MKTVVRTPQVYHLWANQAQDDARNANNSAYFVGNACYSYGAHFMIARHFKNQKGKECVLFTRRTYSKSTSKHIGCARWAIPNNIPVFEVADPCNYYHTDFKGNKPLLEADCALYIEEAKQHVVTGSRARSYGQMHFNSAADCLRNAEAMKTFFALRIKVPAFDSLVSADLLREAKERAEKQARLDEVLAEKRAKEYALQREIDRKEAAVRFKAWQEGAHGSCPYAYTTDADGSAYLRLTADGVVQTSQGAEVPYTQFVRALRFVVFCRERSQAFKCNGVQARVGGFSINEINENGDAHVGCHYFTWKRIQEFADHIGLVVQGNDEILNNQTGEKVTY